MTVGYCTPLSVLPGEPVVLYASGPGGSVDVTVVRDGAHPQAVWRAGGLSLTDAPVPDDAPEHGCAWEPTTTIATDESWPSGLYIVRLNDDSPSAWFVVRAPQPSTDRVLLVLATRRWSMAVVRSRRCRSGRRARR